MLASYVNDKYFWGRLLCVLLFAVFFVYAQVLAEELDLEKMTIEQLNTAAEKNDVDAIFELGHRYLSGEGIEPDSQKAWEYFDKGLATGKPAGIYLYGHIVRQNPGSRFGYKHEDVARKAAEYYRKAAEMGHAPAMYQMGYIYQSFDEGVENDDEKAKMWYQKAADAGDKNAGLKLIEIELAEKGSTGGADNIELLRKGASLGSEENALELARIYLTGEGAPKNYPEAVKLLQTLVESNNGWACWYYAKCLENGLGIEKNEKTAMEYLEKAAEKNVPEAMLRFSHALFEGRQVKKDVMRAYLLAIRMNRMGYREDPYDQDPYEKNLTKEEKRMKDLQKKNTRLVALIWGSLTEAEKVEAKKLLKEADSKF